MNGKNSICHINVNYIFFFQEKRKIGTVQLVGPVKNEIKYIGLPKTYTKNPIMLLSFF